MPKYTVIAAVVALASTMTVIAQQKPDFSGEWQLNRQASMLSPIVVPVAQTGTLRIEHMEPNFKCQIMSNDDSARRQAVRNEIRAAVG